MQTPNIRSPGASGQRTRLAGRFAGRVGIVTGAASGIGEATAALLTREGASVLLVDIHAASLNATVDSLRASGGAAVGLVADVGEEGAAERAVAAAVGAWGALHLLVNNAAAFIQKGVDASAEEWRAVMAVNVMAPALFARAARPHFQAAAGGAIVNIGSISGMTGDVDYATYSSSKAALAILTQCLAADLGPDFVRVNLVSPGITVTPKVREIIDKDFSSFQSFEDAFLPRHCLSRFCQPSDIARAVAFLLSDDASAITGANLVVDAGFMAKKG